MSYFMNYWYPDQPVYNLTSPMYRHGCCCGTPSNSMPYKQQWPTQQPAAHQPPLVPSGNMMTPSGNTFPLPTEQSFIENILRMNRGKLGTFYMTYENNSEWNAKVFEGIIEAAGRDHIIISDPKTQQRILLLMVNFDYATFNEPLNYEYPLHNQNNKKEK